MAFQGKHSDLTGKVIGAFFEVYNRLGYGFSERVYENALAIELKKCGLDVEQQKPIKVYYDEQVVGEYFADMVVERLCDLGIEVCKRNPG